MHKSNSIGQRTAARKEFVIAFHLEKLIECVYDTKAKQSSNETSHTFKRVFSLLLELLIAL